MVHQVYLERRGSALAGGGRRNRADGRSCGDPLAVLCHSGPVARGGERGGVQLALGLGPAAGVPLEQRFQQANVRLARVETGHQIEGRAACRQERRASALGDLLQGLEAVDREPGADDRDLAPPGTRVLLEQRAGVWLEPGLTAESRLKAD